MKCEEVKINLPEYFDRKLDKKTVQAIQSHLETCMECKTFHTELSSFLNFIVPFPELEPPEGMKEEFLELLETEMPRKQKRMVVVPVWLKIAAIFILAMLTYLSGYYIGSGKGRQRQQQMEVALNQAKQQVQIASLLDFSGPQKIDAVYSISKSGQSGDALIDALVATMNSDKNVNVRLAAINALTGMMDKNQRIKQELIRSLPLQDNSLLQISLIQVLTEAGVKEARSEIESIARKENTDERVKAIAKDMIKIII
jgi:hypothetical protein